jgi:hypothetical protein
VLIAFLLVDGVSYGEIDPKPRSCGSVAAKYSAKPTAE